MKTQPKKNKLIRKLKNPDDTSRLGEQFRTEK